jgi:hypothetical protein
MESSILLFFVLGLVIGYLLSGSKTSLIQINFYVNLYSSHNFSNNANNNGNDNLSNNSNQGDWISDSNTSDLENANDD